MTCRICLEDHGPFVHPCSCKGECGNVHAECLTRWVEESGHDYCEICHTAYNKRDVASCNINRFLRKLFSCYMGERNQMYVRFSFIIFGITCATMFLSSFEFLIIQSTITGLLCSFLLLYIYIFEPDEFKDRLYNVALVWKLSYTMPYILNCTLINMQYEQDCTLGCGFLHELCNDECPLWDVYTEKVNSTYTLIYIELFCFGVVVAIRMIVVAYYNFRKLQFVDFEERKALLSSSPSSSSSSPASSASGASDDEASSISDFSGFGLTGITSVSEVA